jgi:uncharacterized protein YcfJ
MSTEDKKEQAINPQPEYEEPSPTNQSPEQDESRIGGQAAGHGSSGQDEEQTGEGTGARAGEYS